MSKVRDKIIMAAREIAVEKPVQEISLAELSRASGVSWPTVRRHVGGREGLPRFLEEIGVDVAATANRHGAEYVDTRSRILQAAFRTFADRGYTGATLDDVAAEASLTKGAVYWHFASKDDLCMALIEERYRSEAIRIPADIRKAVREDTGGIDLVAFVMNEVKQARKSEPWRRLGLEFMSRSRTPAIRKRYTELADRIHYDTIPIAEMLVNSGIFAKDLDPKAVAFTWRCLLLGMGLWMTQDPDGMDFEAMAPKLAELMWRGMAPETKADALRDDKPLSREKGKTGR